MVKNKNNQAIWNTRIKKQISTTFQKVGGSINIDKRLFKEDIQGSIVHVEMLFKQKIISFRVKNKIIYGLKKIQNEIIKKKFDFNINYEDIHMNIEKRLFQIIGDDAGYIHTARSRNDQVITDLKIWMRSNTEKINNNLDNIIKTILKISEKARKSGQLAIVPMKNWKRAMTWPQTGLKWIPTSPNIPTLDSVAGYPMTGLGAQMGKFKHGIGTPQPFRFLTFDGISPADLKTELDNLNIAGLSFQLKTLKNNSGKDIEGVYIVLTDWSKWRPTELAFYMMQLSAKWEAPSPFTQAKESEVTLFNKHVGSSAWWNHLFQSGASCEPRKFLIRWDTETRSFKDKVSKYYLY